MNTILSIATLFRRRSLHSVSNARPSRTVIWRAQALGVLLVTTAAIAQAQLTLSNGASISLNDNAPGSPYPSIISVSGLGGAISKATVGLSGVTHNRPEDLDVLLVGPSGQKVLLMGQAGGNNPVIGVNVTFDDTAAATIPDSNQISVGTYRPADYGAGNLPSPAPPSLYTTLLSAFNGTNPNGTWSLYVADGVVGEAGQVNSGWGLTLSTRPTLSAIANQAIQEDTSLQVSFSVGDAATPTASLLISATSSDQSLVRDANLTISGTGTTRTLTITPAANASGSALISVTVRDADGFTVSSAFQLTVTPVNDAPTITRILPKALFVRGAPPTTSDTQLINRMGSLGFEVTSIADTTSQTSDANGKDLIVISSSVGSGNVSTKFTAVSVPIVTWETAIYDELGIEANNVNGITLTSQTQIEIVDAGHPLASGLTAGVRTVLTTPGDMGSLNTIVPSAQIVARAADGSGRPCIFGIETGAALNPARIALAPARRVGFFLGNDTFSSATSDAQKLFDAAVKWAASLSQDPFLSTIGDQSIFANTSTAPLAFAVSDAETPGGNLVVTASSSNGALVPAANIVLGGSGANRTIRLTGAPFLTGTATIVVTVTDSGGMSTSTSFQLTVISRSPIVWQVGHDDNTHITTGSGGGTNANFVLENGFVNPLPGVPNSPSVNQQADNDYYLAGTYTSVISSVGTFYGSYTPVGVVSANEGAAERAFAGNDHELRYHFNLPTTFQPNDLLSVTFDALDLDGSAPDPRFGIEVYFNGILVQTQIVIRPAQVGMPKTTPSFTLGSVNAEVGPGFDNIVTLRGINYNAAGGGNWMGIDYVQLKQVTPPDTWSYLVVPGLPVIGVAAIPGSSVSSIATPGTGPDANTFPASASPDKGIDWISESKYLNFAEINAGLLLTLPHAKPVSGFRFTTADDAPERDPLNITVEGTTAPDPTTAANGAAWTLLYSGPSGLATNPGRLAQSQIIWFANNAAFNTYRILVTAVRDGVAANSTQFGEIQMFAQSSPTVTGGGLRREVFEGIPGGGVSDLTSNPSYPNSPTYVTLTSSAETPSQIGDNYGQRLRGYLLAPVTGNYTFYISSDDQSQLFLSTDSHPANKVQIAAEPQWNGSRQWNAGQNQVSRGTPPANISAPVTLQEGGVYYVEVLHKEGGGGDNLGVTWQLPGAPTPVNGDPPIAGQYLAYDNSLLLISAQSGNQIVPVGNSVTLSVAATGGTGSYTYRWRKNGVDISGQTQSTFTINNAALSDQGTYTVVVQSGGVSIPSQPIPVVVYQPFDSLSGVSIAFPGGMTPGITTPLGQGNFDVTSPGYGICCTADTFHYSFTAVSGDFDAQVRVARLDNSSPFATAGLMLRQNLSPGSPNVDVQITPPNGDNSYGVGIRATQDGDTSFCLLGCGSGVTIPNAWMRLKRVGNVIIAYRSTDGVNWVQQGQTNLVFSDPVLVGLATTGNNGTTTTAEFRNLQLIGNVQQIVPGALRREVYQNISGISIADLTSAGKFPGAPDVSALTTAFEAPRDFGNNYGQRLSGYLIPPVSGSYVFYISSDDQGALYLSTDASPVNKTQIATEPSWNGFREWGVGSNQGSRGNPPANISAPVNLLAGQRYYVEVLHKEGGGGDSAGVTWRLPDAPVPVNGAAPIPGAYLAFDGSHLRVASQTGSQTVPSGTSATFNVSISGGVGGTTYQWRKDGVNIPGATQASFTLNSAAASDIGTYTVAIQSGVVTILSGPMPLHVYQPFDALAGQDVPAPGSMNGPGSTTPLGGGNFNVTAGGGGLGGTADDFHFSHATLTGDFDAQVRVARLDNSATFAKAGLMIRQNNSPGSPAAWLIVTPLASDNSHKFEFRAAQDAPFNYWDFGSVGGVPVPNAWLRLKRHGNWITAYRGTDGLNWISMGTLKQAFPDSVLFGLCTTAGNNTPGQTTVAEFRNFSISTLPPLLYVEALDASASEAGADPGLFQISISGDRAQPFTASYTISGSADNGVDFETIANAMTIPAGQHSAVIPIKPKADVLAEPYEFVTLTLTPVAGVQMGTASASVGIYDDNPSPGLLKRELYFDILGVGVNQLTNVPQFPNSPGFADVITSFESPSLGDNYGQRLSGLVLPPLTGNYVFYIASDDVSELWLSTDESPVHKTMIAMEPQWNGYREWITGQNQVSRGNPPVNISAPIALQAGQSYYVEVLHKEGIQGDHVAVTWRIPGDPIPANGAAPIPGANLALRVPLAISSLSPATVQSGGPGFLLTINGSGLANGAKVFFNGIEYAATWNSAKQLSVSIAASNITASSEITTVPVFVMNPSGEESNPLVFTIGSAAVAVVESSAVESGGTVVVSTAPTAGSPPEAQAGVEATFNHDGPGAATVTAATYSENPESGTLFDVGGGFVDLQVVGAAPSDSLSANFYYPTTITGATETSLILLYFTGTAWEQVRSSGNTDPVKDTTDNRDGTQSGGRFTVLFDNTSTPSILNLDGTVFAPTTLDVALDDVAPVPTVNPLPTITGACSVTLVPPTATDAVTGPVTATADPKTYDIPGTYTVRWIYNDGNGNIAEQNQTVIVTASPIVLSAITAPGEPVLVNRLIDATASFSGACGPQSAVWSWGDGTTSAASISATDAAGIISGTHTYATPGVYTVSVTLTDRLNRTAEAAFRFVVVYDPTGGFVTGAGWINSPAGAYVANPNLIGKATFGFVSKYQKGATIPTGQTEFQFHAGDFNFHSEAYDWLVIAGPKAQYKGTGTVNGATGFAFLLTATDGQLNGGGADKFRIKIWNKSTSAIFYDNMIGMGDDAEPTTALGGGNIAIQK